MKLEKLIFVFFILTVLGCAKDNLAPNIANIISESEFNNLDCDPYDIQSVEIVGNELSFTVGYGGGCGETTFRLAGMEGYSKSDPPQRNIKLSFTDRDNCEAYLTETLHFNIEALQVPNSNEVVLLYQDEGEERSISYIY